MKTYRLFEQDEKRDAFRVTIEGEDVFVNKNLFFTFKNTLFNPIEGLLERANVNGVNLIYTSLNGLFYLAILEAGE